MSLRVTVPAFLTVYKQPCCHPSCSHITHKILLSSAALVCREWKLLSHICKLAVKQSINLKALLRQMSFNHFAASAKEDGLIIKYYTVVCRSKMCAVWQVLSDAASSSSVPFHRKELGSFLEGFLVLKKQQNFSNRKCIAAKC